MEDNTKIKKRKFKKCGILETDREFEVETTDGKKIKIPKGTKAVIGFDEKLHYLNQQLVEEIDPEYAKIKGVSARGLCEYLFGYLDSCVNLEEILKNNNVTYGDFIDYMISALDYIGLEDDYWEYYPEKAKNARESVAKTIEEAKKGE